MIEVSCLDCGMILDEHVKHCPKCDNVIDQQTDGSTITVDIAHQGETVRAALMKLDRELELGRSGIAKNLRFIVGTGLIREEVLRTLNDLQRRSAIIRFNAEAHNPGAIVIQIKA